jgi:hypothetical protein
MPIEAGHRCARFDLASQKAFAPAHNAAAEGVEGEGRRRHEAD